MRHVCRDVERRLGADGTNWEDNMTTCLAERSTFVSEPQTQNHCFEPTAI